MTSIFEVKQFSFPYDQHRFPGQATDERILYVTREHVLFLWLRIAFVLLLTAGILMASYVFGLAFRQIFPANSLGFTLPITLLLAGVFAATGWWWVHGIWHKSLAIVTNKRLIKIIYTTPVNRYNQSLPLEMIVDTSCNNQGFVEGVAHAWLQIGTLTARSSASSSGVATEDTDRVNKKYFYLENIQYCEDLQQYLNKIISLLHQSPEQLQAFRPFIPHLKGELRQKFLEDYAKRVETKE